jgi:hypothetical protein
MSKTVLVAFALAAPATAYAYFDPGTGALVIQGLIGALAAVAVFWGRLRAYVRRLFSRGTDTTSSVSSETNARSEGHPDVEKEVETKPP